MSFHLQRLKYKSKYIKYILQVENKPFLFTIPIPQSIQKLGS